MIGWLGGKIIDKETPGKFVIDVNGVGYDVETSMATFFCLESQSDTVGLHVHTVVREDAILLYGFAEKEERTLFRALIKVNGIGPKMAITILSSTSPEEFVACINQQDTARLTKLPGIGKKTAERIVVEMKDKLQQWSPAASGLTPFAQSMVSEQDEATKALEALGYKHQEASKMIKQVDDGQMNCETLIRASLKYLASGVK